ncbi:MAG: hypothetical protein RLZZ352_2612 [Pseudomonadota bacterium]|jgi:hypothetical protein
MMTTGLKTTCKTAFKTAAVLLAVFSLSACGDATPRSTGARHDAAPHQGVGASQYAQGGWKAGDRTSWEQHLKARAQYGQNDYSRMPNQ